ncbi:hypothetical protein KUTeg_006490 [Tegillarca granosa]|uniref:PiggyBac transposable element-derived protein domain-containing protein n=1 Tax=Tegillarca granosa TaxID=220873 RepID=A0ABQ9FGM3_TEGGR|nr:hypothetical protein KUTeg_006490 [Tegillarca granosa]
MPEAIRSKSESLTMQKENLTGTALKDKKSVTYLSTCSDPKMVRTIQRRQKDASVKDIPATSVSELYNKYMFVVDIADQKRMQYSTCRKAKKWYKYLF